MSPSSRPLVVTADGPLLDEVLGVAGAAGVAVDVAVDIAAARPQWRDAPVVLVGGDAVAGLVTARLPPRAGVLLVHTGGPPALAPGADGLLDRVLGLPAEEDVLLAHLATPTDPRRPATTIAVLPGRGGAGASTLAAAVALVAAGRGEPTWLVDLDPSGGGIDAVVGAELAPGVRWSGLSETAGRLSPDALRDAVPSVLGVAVVSCDRETTDPLDPCSVGAVLGAAGRDGGTVVLDLPRHPTSARAQALPTVDRLLVVASADVRAVLAARHTICSLERMPSRADLVVRTAREGLPPAEVSRALELPLAGVLADEPSVRAAAAIGSAEELRRGSLLRLCEDLLSDLEGRAA